jgi:hypothetical protein
MPHPSELILGAEAGTAGITADDVLREFLALQHEWGFRPFRFPADFPPEEQVTLPGPDVLADRARRAEMLMERR